MSRRASEESSASGGASSDRPVGGAHGYSWLRPLRTMGDCRQAVSDLENEPAPGNGRAEDQICHG